MTAIRHPPRDQGYVLAGALAALMAMSVVAVALVGASGAVSRRTHLAEQDVHEALRLRSAIMLTGAQLAQDPARRLVTFENGRALLGVSGSEVAVEVSHEGERLDINAADMKELDRALLEAGAADIERANILDAIGQARLKGDRRVQPEDLPLPGHAKACLHVVATGFHGRTAAPESGPGALTIGRPGAGERMRISAAPPSGGKGLTAVILMTGDAAAPFEVLDIRSGLNASKEACHATDAH